MTFSKVDEAVKDFKNGKFILIVDRKEREDEADLVIAAQFATPENINFLIKNARGLVCVPMTSKRLDELNLGLMVETNSNTEFTKCAFTIPVDVKKDTTTGISAFDRSATIKALIDPKSKPEDFAKPGHIFPLRADENGLKGRRGHTEACIELCNLSELYLAAVLCEMVGSNGKMAKLPELEEFSKKHSITMIKIEDLVKENPS